MHDSLGNTVVLDPAIGPAIGPVLDPLLDGVAGQDFATRFRDLLPHRLWRLAQALEDDDADRALDAVLSLRVSAATLGARQLSALAAGVERALRAGDLAGTRRAAAELAPAARRLHAVLAAVPASAGAAGPMGSAGPAGRGAAHSAP